MKKKRTRIKTNVVSHVLYMYTPRAFLCVTIRPIYWLEDQKRNTPFNFVQGFVSGRIRVFWLDLDPGFYFKGIGVFTFIQKQTKTSQQVVKLNLFGHFFGEMSAWKNQFEFVWPLLEPVIWYVIWPIWLFSLLSSA